MARLTRVNQKVFASSAANNGVFGSAQAGNPQTSNDVATLQSLPAFLSGWDSAAYSGEKLPPLEEFQGIQYGISYQQAYMLQEGIAEWNADTTYFKGSFCKTISGSSFKLYCSLTDNNLDNVVSNTTHWKIVMDSDDLYTLQSTTTALQNTVNAIVPNLLSALYPVGAVYIGSQATCPLQNLMPLTTWVLVGTKVLLGITGSNVTPVVGNGLQIGLDIASRSNTGIRLDINADYVKTDGYGGKVSFSSDPTRSGLVADLTYALAKTELTANVWRRTA